MQYSPDGTRLAVASGIGIWLYDTATHQEIALLTGHTNSVDSVAFGVKGRTIASGSWDGRNQNGEPVTSGTYYYQLRAGDFTALQRMAIVN